MRYVHHSLLRPAWQRWPLKPILFSIALLSCFIPLYALSKVEESGLTAEAWQGGVGSRLAIVSIFVAWIFVILGFLRKIQDPRKRDLPHSGLMIPAAMKLIHDYEEYRRDVILERHEKAGELGFLGGCNSDKFEVSRFSILNVRRHAEKSLNKIRRLESVRQGDKLRVFFYTIEGGVDKVELIARKVDRFLRSKGVDPEDVAPTRPLPSGE